jgi:4-amino-4-deoxy-L-arabinose transferase-like glycosyltransferase
VSLVSLIYVIGVALRLDYTLVFHPPAKSVFSDMEMYVGMANELRLSAPTTPAQVTHPLGFPFLLACALGSHGSLERATLLQLGVSLLVPPAAGLLGASAFGRRTGFAAAAFASLYFPFIEYGALFLSEIHFIFFLALAFAGFLSATRAAGRRALAFAFLGGVALSLALSMKAVVLPGAICFFAVYVIALRLVPATQRPPARRVAAMTLAAILGALPLTVQLARVCTRANGGTFCVTGNKSGADFLLGHYGRILMIQWKTNPGYFTGFGSPSSYLRHYDKIVQVPFPIYDNRANAAEAWRWVKANPFEATVLSFDHVYDTFFGSVMFPSEVGNGWMWAYLAQPLFVLCLLLPTTFVLMRLAQRGFRALLGSRALLVFSPVIGLIVTLLIATGEVRYRVPFDLFFIVVACALLTGDFQRTDAPDSARRSPPRAWRGLGSPSGKALAK